MVDVQYDDMDWDYYDYGADEMKDKEKMSGIAKFEHITIYKHSEYKDDNMNHIDISVNVEDLIDKYGLFAKNSDLLKFGGNLKAYEKQDIQIQQQKYQNATVPEIGQGKLISQNDEQRVKSGGNVVSFPQTSIGLVIVKFKNGKENRGTGSLIGPNQVLTAAHILYDHNQNKQDNQITEIDFISGLCGCITQYQPAIVLKALLLEQYQNKDTSQENDLAVLVLNKPQGLYCGWFGLIRLPDDTLKMDKIEVSGYPTDKQNDGFIQYSDKGKIDVLTEEFIEYNLDTSAGQNGGPIILERIASETYSEFYLTGIHIGYNGKHNYGIRINKKKYESLRDIVQYHFLKESLDETYFLQLIKDQYQTQINFEHTFATVHNINNFFFQLRSNIELKTIHIKTKTRNQSKHLLTNESLKELSDSLKVLRKLENLKLDLHNCDNITDEGLKILNIGIQSLKDMKDLYLIFTENKTFTSAGLKDFSISFQSLQKLDNLVLVLSNIKSLTDDGLKYLGANIIKIQNLQTLQLDLQGLKKCTEKGIRDMCGSLKQLKNLQKLSLIVMGTKITDQTKNDIKANFKHVPNFHML